MTDCDELYVFNVDNLRFCWLNQQSINALGYLRDELLTMRVIDIYPEFTADNFSEMLAPLLANQLAELSFEAMQQAYAKPLHRVSVHLEVFGDQERRYVHARVKNQSFKNQQQQARLVSMGEMIGNIAHQWRQPLNALAIILLNLEDALSCGKIDSQEMRPTLVRAQQILSDMSCTIDDFRGILRNDKLMLETVLAEVVSNSVKLLKASMAYQQISLVFINPDCPLTAMLVPGQLSQVLLCIINNAKEQLIRKKLKNGEIRVSIEQHSQWAEIRIADNAGGIPESDLQKVFDPYFSTKPDGIGLGLYASNQAIQQTMSGRIEVKNCDKGAQFSVFLPISATKESLS